VLWDIPSSSSLWVGHPTCFMIATGHPTLFVSVLYDISHILLLPQLRHPHTAPTFTLNLTPVSPSN
jgi:hypothetical protein